VRYHLDYSSQRQRGPVKPAERRTVDSCEQELTVQLTKEKDQAFERLLSRYLKIYRIASSQ
jgi:hypothetical protein